MKENTRSNPIFVTGAPRSGTTWVGKMLALSKKIGYIHEPFNTDHNIGRISKQFDYRFQYIEIDEKSKYEKLFIDLIDFKYNLNEFIINSENKSFQLIQNNTHPNFYLVDILSEKKKY